MSEETKEKLNVQRLLITLGIVLLAALVVGGTTWYVMDKSAKEVQAANEKSVAELQKQIDELNTSKTKETADLNTATANPTASWVEYKNDTYGFSAKYPTGYFASAKEGTTENVAFYVNFIADKYKDGPGVGLPFDNITIYPKKASELNLWINGEFPNIISGTLKAETVGELKGYSFQSDGLGGTHKSYVFTNSDKSHAYVISGLESGRTVNFEDFVKTLTIN